jgi:hypothetical protein
MTKIHPASATGAASCADEGAAAALGLGKWLALAAAPTFAIMALATSIAGGDGQDMVCAAAHSASPLNGMVAMYVLMSAFHSVPWLRLVSSRRSGAQQPPLIDLR